MKKEVCIYVWGWWWRRRWRWYIVSIGGSGEVDEITDDESVATPRHRDIIIPWVHG